MLSTMKPEELQAYTLANPEIMAAFIRANPTSYENFVEQLQKDLDQAVQTTQSFRQYTSSFTEDDLTIYLIGILKAFSYQAYHDPAHGGHVDIYVGKRNFIWLGEAKIYDGSSKVLDGFYQLCTRYSTGAINENKGGLLIYIQDTKTTADVMKEWNETILTQYKEDPKFSGLTTASCTLNPACFISTHTHETSGNPYSVRHIPVNVSFNPRDGKKRPPMARKRATKGKNAATLADDAKDQNQTVR